MTMADRVLAATKYLKLIDRDGWTFVQRAAGTGVVTIVPVTDDGKLVLVEQERKALQRPVIELPAGLVGDDAGAEEEALAVAARRELLEETGYEADRLEELACCPTSPGLTDEVVTFFLASGLRKLGSGGGVEQERITTHEVAWSDVPRWLHEQAAAGRPVAAKVYAGLFFASRALGLP
jgi:ADP-ribose pyrophosphatase